MARNVDVASSRLVAKVRHHDTLGEDWNKRIDAIDETEAYAIPIIERHLSEREASAAALKMDALDIEKNTEAMKKAADTLSNSGRPLDSQQQSQGSGETQQPNPEEPAPNPTPPPPPADAEKPAGEG